MLEEKQDLSLIECSILSGYAHLTFRTAIKLGQLPAALIKIKNRPTYVIKRADFEAWLATKGRRPHQEDDNGLAMQCPQCSSKMEYPDCMECGYIVPGSLADY